MKFSDHDQLYIQDWMEMQPYEKPDEADRYYLKLCNEIQQLLKKSDLIKIFEPNNDLQKQLTVMLVSWFSDVVSEAGIWKAFINRHYELYGKYLPFYDLGDYFEDEINPQDIYFLIWYYISIIFEESIPHTPEDYSIAVLGDEIYEVFDNEWDKAPVNRKLKAFLQIPVTETDFYKVRYVYDWLVLKSYLFFIYGEENEERKQEIIAEESNSEDMDIKMLNMFLFESHDEFVSKTITSLLAMRGSEWLAYVLGKDHPLFEPLLKVTPKKTGKFLFLGEDERVLHFRYLASGKEIHVSKKSLSSNKLKPDFTVVTMSVVEWMNEWWFSGVMVSEDMSDDLLLTETAHPHKASLFETIDSFKEALAHQYSIFCEFNGGKPLSFVANANEMYDLFDNYFQFHNDKKELERQKKGLSSKTHQPIKNPRPKEKNELDEIPRMIYFNPETGLEVVIGYNSIVPDPDNPYYDPDYDSFEVLELFSSDYVSKELSCYLIQNYNLKPTGFLGGDDASVLMNNLDFIFRFYKKESYHAKPQISFI